MPAHSTRTKVYLVRLGEIAEIVDGRSNDYRPCKETPVVVSVSTKLRPREVAEILSDLAEYIRRSQKNAKSSRAERRDREKIYRDLS